MVLQKVFKDSYTQALKDDVRSGKSVDLYSKDSFEVDNSQTYSIKGIYAAEGLAEKLKRSKDDDFESATHLFEAYKSLSPVVAVMESFWAYLTHTELFEYTKLRWPMPDGEDKRKNNITDHWFVGSQGLLRNSAASLWWGIYLTVDEEREDKYELSKILFKNYTFRVMTMGSTRLIRHREAMIGILGFLADNPEILNEHFENRGRFISLYFSRLGAVKQLAGLDRNFFMNECEKIKDLILKVETRADIGLKNNIGAI